MCRIMVNPGNIEYKADDLYEFLLGLNRVGGGDGMGIYDCEKDVLIKGLEDLPKLDYTSRFLYHCRNATHGNVADYNCQPFVGKRYAVVHNGIFSQRDDLCKFYGFDPDKYSDSYLIFKMIEDKGILPFWNGFQDDSYGVVVVYDKKHDAFYLLKSSGAFQAGYFTKSEKFMYASSYITYWKDCEAEDFGKGMWKLTKDGAVRLHKPQTKSYSYRTYNYGGYHNYYTKGKTGTGVTVVSQKPKKPKKEFENMCDIFKTFGGSFESLEDMCDNAPDEFWKGLTEDQDIGEFIENKS